MMAESWQIHFYNSSAWKKLRNALIAQRGLRCERCGKMVHDSSKLIGHHIKELDADNVHDTGIALNPDNIEIICKDCHDIEHKRFKGKGLRQHNIYLVYGAPCSGKTTLVNRIADRGDMIIDYDALFKAISGRDMYDRPDNLKSNVFQLRDTLIDAVRTRYGKWNNAYIIGGYPHKIQREELKCKLGAEEIYVDATEEECIARARETRGVWVDDWIKYIKAWFADHD